MLLSTHGTSNEKMVFGFQLDWIDSTHTLVMSKTHLLISCITRYLEIHHFLTNSTRSYTSPPVDSSYNANTRFLQEANNFIKALQEASPPQIPFFTKFKKLVKFHKQKFMTRAATYRLEGARLRESLEFWQVQLHLDSQSEAIVSSVLLNILGPNYKN